jgi:hypothetical protein
LLVRILDWSVTVLFAPLNPSVPLLYIVHGSRVYLLFVRAGEGHDPHVSNQGSVSSLFLLHISLTFHLTKMIQSPTHIKLFCKLIPGEIFELIFFFRIFYAGNF